MAAAAGTLTYRFPAVVAAGAVAPTKAQLAGGNRVVVDVAMPDNAAATPIIHNLGVSAAGLDGSPKVSISCIVAGTAPATPVWTVTDGNTISLLQVPNAGAGNGCTWRLDITSPHSLGT